MLNLLQLSCTEQLQKWHKRTRKGQSIPMIPLKDIKVKSAKMKKKDGRILITAADPTESYLKRDVQKIMDDLSVKLDQEKPIENHFYNVLMKANGGLKTALGQHLHYKSSLAAAEALIDHDYLKTDPFTQNFSRNTKEIETSIHKFIQIKSCNLNQPKRQESQTEEIIAQNVLDIFVEKPVTVYSKLTQSEKSVQNSLHLQISQKIGCILLDICFMEGPDPFGANYVKVIQNSEAWLEARRFKITGSRLPSLLGMHGSKKFYGGWATIKTGKKEEDISNIPNVARGKYFEEEALRHLMKESGATIKTCGFFNHPWDNRYGASPDGLGPAGILIEVKTRAAGSEGPIEDLSKFAHYFAQCQLQMLCTDAEYTILQSYHPETSTSNYFAIRRHSTLLAVIKDVADAILEDKAIKNWSHNETTELQRLGETLEGQVPNFQNIKGLRSFINMLSKSVPQLKFVDNINVI